MPSPSMMPGPECAPNCTICWSVLQSILQGFSKIHIHLKHLITSMMKVCPPLRSKVLPKRHSNAIDLKIPMALARLGPCHLLSEFNCIHVHVCNVQCAWAKYTSHYFTNKCTCPPPSFPVCNLTLDNWCKKSDTLYSLTAWGSNDY